MRVGNIRLYAFLALPMCVSEAGQEEGGDSHSRRRAEKERADELISLCAQVIEAHACFDSTKHTYCNVGQISTGSDERL